MENVKISNTWYGNRIRIHLIVVADSERFGKNTIMYEGSLDGCIRYLRRHGIYSYKANY